MNEWMMHMLLLEDCIQATSRFFQRYVDVSVKQWMNVNRKCKVEVRQASIEKNNNNNNTNINGTFENWGYNYFTIVRSHTRNGWLFAGFCLGFYLCFSGCTNPFTAHLKWEKEKNLKTLRVIKSAIECNNRPHKTLKTKYFQDKHQMSIE